MAMALYALLAQYQPERRQHRLQAGAAPGPRRGFSIRVLVTQLTVITNIVYFSYTIFALRT